MNKFVFIFVFIILSICGIANALPPQVNYNTDVGLEIKFPQTETIKYNHSYELNFHVFNISTGLPVYNETGKGNVGCFFHLYNSTGEHIINVTINNMDERFDFTYTIDSSNFSKEGTYPYMIQCNSSDIGGFVSGKFEATYSGLQKDTSLAYILLLIPLIIAGLLFFAYSQIDPIHYPLKIFFLLLAFCFILIDYSLFYYVEWTYLSDIELYTAMQHTIFIWCFYAVLAYVGIIFIRQIFMYMNQFVKNKKNKQNGMNNEGGLNDL